MQASRPNQPAPGNDFIPFQRGEIEQSIPERFAATVARYPDRLAVRDGPRTLTYRELDAASDGLAARLQGSRSAGGPVALLLDQGLPFITGLVAVLKAGAIVVPLDSRNPESRNRLFLEDTEARLLVTAGEHRPMAEALGPDRVILDLADDSAATTLRGNGGPRNVPSIAPAHPAVILFTSGSTGRPKGVLQTHRNVLHNTLRHTNAFRIHAGDRQSLFYPCGVYGGFRDIFNALLNGACLCRYAVEVDGLAPMADWLRDNQVSIYCSVATVFRQFVRTLSGQDFPDLRLIKLGGESVSRDDFTSFREHFSPRALLSCGLAATEIGAVRQEFLSGDSTIETRRLPCGQPVEDMEILILDEDRNPVSTGREGEIAVRSAFISPGYWNRPELTAAAFLPDPDGGDRRIYRTGDLGRVDADGRLYHLGRIDAQVKVRGNRVELPEVEAALMALSPVREAAVVLHADPERGDRLHAFVVPEGEAPDVANLREELARRLPAFMIPSRIGMLESLPLLPSGKVDRQELAGREIEEAVASGAGDSPPGGLGETGERLQKLWREAVGAQTVDPDIDFFAAGGDSLGMLQLVVEIEQEFGIRFPISIVLEAPTLKKLAARIDKERDKESVEEPDDQPDAGPQRARDEALSSPDSSSLRLAAVPIRGSGSRTPLFLVAPAGGTVLPYYRLAHLLGPEQPVYGLQVHSPSFLNTRGFDIEPMAAGLIPLMRAIQPEGPYRLGGWSFGGFVAWEMARQLGEAGVSVDRVVIADSDISMADTRPSLKTLVRGVWLAVQGLRYSKPVVRDTLHMRLANKMRPDSEKKPGILARMAWRTGLRKAPISDMIAADSRLELLKESPRSLLTNSWAYFQAIRRYQPRPLDQEVDLVLPEDPSLTISGDTEEAVRKGWGKMSNGRLRIHRVPGNHFTLFYPPAVDDMARKLGESLASGAGPDVTSRAS